MEQKLKIKSVSYDSGLDHLTIRLNENTTYSINLFAGKNQIAGFELMSVSKLLSEKRWGKK